MCLLSLFIYFHVWFNPLLSDLLLDSDQCKTLRIFFKKSTQYYPPSCAFLTFSWYQSMMCAQPLNHTTVKDPERKLCLVMKATVLLGTTILSTMITNTSTSEKNNYFMRPPSFNGDVAHFSWWKSKMYNHIIGVDDQL